MFRKNMDADYHSNRKRMKMILIGSVVGIGIVSLGICVGLYKVISSGGSANSIQENVPNFGTEDVVDSSTENVPNFGTTVKIKNLDEVATPLLEERSSLLEVKLSEYVLENALDETESEIIHVMIPEENVNQLYFFCKFLDQEEIVVLIYDQTEKTVVSTKCEYTEEEVINEVWEGICPEDRDVQE